MKVLVLAVAIAVASSPTPKSLGDATSPSDQPTSTRLASLTCDTMGFGSGTCPSPLNQCRIECDDGYAHDTLRCMSGSGGILPQQRAICHGVAAMIFAQCHRNCNDSYPAGIG